MAESHVWLTCEWCQERFLHQVRRGPKPKYCGNGHKQRAYEMRKLATILVSLGWSPEK